MTALVLFSKACVLGCMVAIPVGPVALLIIQRSLSVSHMAGFFTGLGAALADGVFGFLAALGLAALIGEVEFARPFLRPLGSLALAVMGVHFFFQSPPKLVAEEVLSGRYQRRFWWDTISAFFLTLMNPTTIIAFAVLFAGSDLIPEDPKKIQYLEVAAGVFVGSLIWWVVLGAVARPIKKRMNPVTVHRVLQMIGVALVVLALVSFIPRFGGTILKIRELLGI